MVTNELRPRLSVKPCQTFICFLPLLPMNGIHVDIDWTRTNFDLLKLVYWQKIRSHVFVCDNDRWLIDKWQYQVTCTCINLHYHLIMSSVWPWKAIRLYVVFAKFHFRGLINGQSYSLSIWYQSKLTIINWLRKWWILVFDIHRDSVNDVLVS